MNEEPKDKQLFILMADAVQDGLKYVSEVQAAGGYFGTHYEWPELSWFENGMPRLSKKIWDSPKDYKSAFRPRLRGLGLSASYREFKVEEWPSFVRLIEYIKSADRLRTRFLPDTFEDKGGFIDSWILMSVESAVDRYVHSNKTTTFIPEQFLPIYLPLECRLADESLRVDVCVPILFLKFDAEEVHLTDRASIARMPEDFHLARAMLPAYSPSVHEVVLSGATHALVLTQYYIPNSHLLAVSQVAGSALAFPNHEIDAFFAALRVVTGFDTGYAQLIFRPVGWALSYKANLPPLEGTAVRQYPPWFEDFYWNKEVPFVGKEEIAQVGTIFTKLIGADQTRAGKKLILAARRLNRCFLREDEEDAVLDATIGLEVLLSDESPQEMTHKLALRVAAISTLAKGFQDDPLTVFRNVKQVYKVRSAIVHGQMPGASKKREIGLSDKANIPMVKVAISYLRMTLMVLLGRPELLSPPAVDESLLVGALKAQQMPPQ